MHLPIIYLVAALLLAALPALFMIKRAPRQSRHRTRLPATYQPQVPPLTWTAAIVATKARITTNLPFTLSGLPVGITVQGIAPTAITQITPTSFDLTYAAAVVSTNVLVIPAGAPQVRGAAGGTLAAGTFTFP